MCTSCYIKLRLGFCSRCPSPPLSVYRNFIFLHKCVTHDFNSELIETLYWNCITLINEKNINFILQTPERQIRLFTAQTNELVLYRKYSFTARLWYDDSAFFLNQHIFSNKFFFIQILHLILTVKLETFYFRPWFNNNKKVYT